MIMKWVNGLYKLSFAGVLAVGFCFLVILVILTQGKSSGVVPVINLEQMIAGYRGAMWVALLLTFMATWVVRAIVYLPTMLKRGRKDGTQSKD